MLRGCSRLENTRKIARFLSSLYGAELSAGVSKIGERQIIYFTLNIVRDRFLPQKIFGNAIEFLRRFLIEPLLENGGFRAEYVKQEKKHLIRFIEALIDDRYTYALRRAQEETCKNEKYAVSEYGEPKEIDRISPKGLYKRFQDIITNAPCDIFVSGDFRSTDKLAAKFKDLANVKRSREIQDTLVNVPVSAEREIVEEKNVEQANLVLSLRTYTTWQNPDIYSMILYSGILGGFPHSKLFKNIREKEGLSYYIKSQLDKSKGMMFIRAGINFSCYKKAVKQIKAQIWEIQNGNISTEELDSTKKSICDDLKSLEDHPSDKINVLLTEIINKRQEDIKDTIEKIISVRREDVIKVAQKPKIDTIYLLTNKK